MKRLDLTLDSPAANLALDEALLETAEATPDYQEVLRIWEPNSNLVVLGRSSPIERETNLEFCRQQNIDVLRRCSGGQSIVTGPGCLMYAVLLDYRKRPELRMLETAHHFVMTQVQQAIKRLDLNVQMQGTSDLTFQGRKFSGNSLRCKKNWLVYHGTLLCDFDLGLIENCLGTPIREPDYRQNRTHLEFLTQLPVTTTKLATALIEQWDVGEPLEHWPQQLTRQLATDKYQSDDWTFKVK